jgi:hypothetical protein
MFAQSRLSSYVLFENMPIGEAIAEIVIRPIFELIFYGVAYWVGYLGLSILSLGQLKLAPLMSIDQKNRKKKGKIDWSIWLHRPMQGRVLKAEVVCLSGLLFVAGAAFSYYFITRDTNQSENKSVQVDPFRSGSSFLNSEF